MIVIFIKRNSRDLSDSERRQGQHQGN